MDDESNIGIGSGGTTARWNPTKEQITMLEGLYRQGVRTPSAEQIQQITARLRAFGHIEGKNVFYWFQNHKARQRQKQKQENMAYLNRFLRPPTTPPIPNNVMCGPYYVAQGEMGYLQQYPKMIPVPVPVPVSRIYCPQNDVTTLPLFPLHPTGLQTDAAAYQQPFFDFFSAPSSHS